MIISTFDNWLKEANRPDSKLNLKLILDLDENILSSKGPLGRINHLISIRINDRFCYVDYQAINNVAKIQKKGVEIIVVTNATYLFSVIYEIFKLFGIKLLESNYYNRSDTNLKKASFIDGIFKDSLTLLLDDDSKNEPSSEVLFKQTSPHIPFPLKIIDNQLVIYCLSIRMDFDEIWDNFTSNTHTASHGEPKAMARRLR